MWLPDPPKMPSKFLWNTRVENDCDFMRENKNITENSLNRAGKYYEYLISISGRLSVLER